MKNELAYYMTVSKTMVHHPKYSNLATFFFFLGGGVHINSIKYMYLYHLPFNFSESDIVIAFRK